MVRTAGGGGHEQRNMKSRRGGGEAKEVDESRRGVGPKEGEAKRG